MRGRTLSNSFVILDEAQNASGMQMKMFLTRLGVNSKAIVTGDITQIDLPQKSISGLVEIQKVLKSVEGISFVYLEKLTSSGTNSSKTLSTLTRSTAAGTAKTSWYEKIRRKVPVRRVS